MPCGQGECVPKWRELRLCPDYPKSPRDECQKLSQKGEVLLN